MGMPSHAHRVDDQFPVVVEMQGDDLEEVAGMVRAERCGPLSLSVSG